MNRSKYIIFLIAFALPIFSQLKKIKKAFYSLSIYNYFDARRKFHQIWKKNHNPYAAYGLSIIYGRSDNPFYNLDSAIRFANRARLNLHRYPEKKIHGYEINTSSVLNQINHLSLLQWHSLKKNKISIDAINNFLQHHYLCSPVIIEDACNERLRLISEYCLSIGHPDTTEHYMLLYPDEKNIHVLNKIYQTQLYQYSTKGRTIDEYYNFIEKYPNHFKRNDALAEIFSICKNNNDTTCWLKLIRKFPNESITKKAWLELFLLSMKHGIKAKDFMVKFPGFPYNEDLIQYAEFKKNIFFVYEDSSGVGITDTNCHEQIPIKFDEIVLPSENGPGYVKKDDSIRFINASLNIILPNVYADTEGFHQFFAAVKDFNNRWFFIFTDGSVVSDTMEKISITEDLHYVFEKKKLKGIMDINANIRISPEFDEITPCGHFIYHFRKKNKFGLILKDFQIKSTDAEHVSLFRNGYAVAVKDGSYGIINTKGDWILKPDFRYIRQYSENENLFMCFENNLKGIYFNAKEQCTLAYWSSSSSDRELSFLESGNGNWLSIYPTENKKNEFISYEGTKLFPLPQNWEIKEPGMNFHVICKNKKNELQIFNLKENKFILRKNAYKILKWNKVYYFEIKSQGHNYGLLSPEGIILFSSKNEIEKLNERFCKTITEEGLLLLDMHTGKKISNVLEYTIDSSGNIFVKFKNGRCKLISLEEKNLNFEK